MTDEELIRRRRILALPNDHQLLQILRGQAHLKLPADARILRSGYNYATDCVEIVLASATYDTVEPFCMPPLEMPTFHYYGGKTRDIEVE